MRGLDFFIYVVVPVYNSMKYLQEAIDSVIVQNLGDLEIVLVDDGSTDGSSKLCDELAEIHDFITVIHQKNDGVSSARNRAMDYIFSVSKEKKAYIAFLDADDQWKGGAINCEIKQLLNEGYDCIGLQSVTCNSKLTRCQPPVRLLAGRYRGGEYSMRIHHTQSFAAMFYNVEFLKANQIRFYPVCYSEDKVFSMQCLFSARRTYLKNSVLYLYRNNPSSAMNIRKYGIHYYEPIVRAYIQMDEDLSRKYNLSVSQGKILARVYLIDMIKEHYRFGGTKKELDAFFADNPELFELLHNRAIGNYLLNRRLDELENMQLSNIILRKLFGVLYKSGKKLIGTVYAKLTEKTKYPMEINDLDGGDKT